MWCFMSGSRDFFVVGCVPRVSMCGVRLLSNPSLSLVPRTCHSKAKPTPMCPFHGLPIEYLCLEDDCLVCVKCLPSPIHNGHRCKCIPEALADENRMISADLMQEGR